tara:strand:+ start:246 stop:761 length:516 start_codon:yes stop_codon:yes gene_type:complete
MRNYKDFVAEIKSTADPSEWDWIEKSTSMWYARYHAYDIDLGIEQSGGIRVDGKHQQVWQVGFQRGGKWSVTGEGDAKMIFAWVIERVLDFMKTNPRVIRFTSDKGDSTRGKLYDTMVRIVGKKLKNHYPCEIPESEYENKKGKPYFIVHKDLKDQDDLKDQLIKYNNSFA